MATKQKKKDGAGDMDLSNSILARLIEEQKERSADELFSDVAVLFCGMKKSGKTSIIDRFINPSKDDKDQPKPTVALDYKFARYASETSTSKVLAHIYDLGGDESFEDLLTIPVSPATIGNLVLAVTLDLSEPQQVIPDLEKWLARLHTQVPWRLIEEKNTMNAMRNLLRQLLFGVAAKGGIPEQLDSSKPICVLAGKDNLQNIGAPAGGKDWKGLCTNLFSDLKPNLNAGGRAEGDKVADELLKYPESSVDGMVEQRAEELQQYRRQVERNQRLASEGVDGVKLGLA